jgi:hypothetical protein
MPFVHIHSDTYPRLVRLHCCFGSLPRRTRATGCFINRSYKGGAALYAMQYSCTLLASDTALKASLRYQLEAIIVDCSGLTLPIVSAGWAQVAGVQDSLCLLLYLVL